MSRDDTRRDAIEESRREVELRLAEVRESIGREIGLRPKAKYSLIALVAASTGFALAMGGRRGRRRRGKKKRR
jgi:hypothetical protein